MPYEMNPGIEIRYIDTPKKAVAMADEGSDGGFDGKFV
jgi:hypothetical protein